MIVKVQISLNNPRAALVYDEAYTLGLVPYVMLQCSPSQDVLLKMAGRPKAFFHATLRGSNLELNTEAPWQEW